jgi:hypothetical protein
MMLYFLVAQCGIVFIFKVTAQVGDTFRLSSVSGRSERGQAGLGGTSVPERRTPSV